MAKLQPDALSSAKVLECSKCKTRFSEWKKECPYCHEIDTIVLSPEVMSIQTIDCGKNISDPILVSGETGLIQYLSLLRTTRNEVLTWNLQNSYSVRDIGTVRAYKASTERGFYAILYFSINGMNNPTFAPKDFILTPLDTKDNEAKSSKLLDEKSEKQTESIGDNKSIEQKSQKSSAFTIDLLDKKLHPKIRRAAIFLEDGEWEKADACIENVLDEDPTNAYAYLGKTMIGFEAHSVDELKKYADVLIDDKTYLKAIRFADEVLVNKLLDLQSQ